MKVQPCHNRASLQRSWNLCKVLHLMKKGRNRTKRHFGADSMALDEDMEGGSQLFFCFSDSYEAKQPTRGRSPGQAWWSLLGIGSDIGNGCRWASQSLVSSCYQGERTEFITHSYVATSKTHTVTLIFNFVIIYSNYYKHVLYSLKTWVNNCEPTRLLFIKLEANH